MEERVGKLGRSLLDWVLWEIVVKDGDGVIWETVVEEVVGEGDGALWETGVGEGDEKALSCLKDPDTGGVIRGAICISDN